MRQLKIQKSITNRSSEALDKYLVEIGRAPLISIDEEIELAQKIKKGGPEGERAKDKLVTANLRFVVSVAKQQTSTRTRLDRALLPTDIISALTPPSRMAKTTVCLT
jgi:DNA-directed RNA polymerase sigma subunit (sigma70/sigma32)